MARKAHAPQSSEVHSIHDSLASLRVEVGRLTLDPNNARSHNEQNISAIEHSLKEFGQRKPIVVRRSGMVIIAGNGTFTAAKKLGWTHVAAVIVEEDELKSKAFALADNRTAELAAWDFAVLGDAFKDLDSVGMLTGLGWSPKELEMLMGANFKPEPLPPTDDLPTELDDSPTTYKIDKAKLAKLGEVFNRHASTSDTFGEFVLRAVLAHYEPEAEEDSE